MNHRIATPDDAPLLARLNRQLTEDENHHNRRNPLPWFEQRMRSFLSEGYAAALFEDDGQIVAYALFREADQAVYLRQFFVVRDRRRRGVGRAAIELLIRHVWPPDRRITLGVLTHNPAARAFWAAMGFTEYAVEMERLSPEQSPGDA